MTSGGEWVWVVRERKYKIKNLVKARLIFQKQCVVLHLSPPFKFLYYEQGYCLNYFTSEFPYFVTLVLLQETDM